MATSIIGSIQIPKGTKVTIDVDTELSPDSQNPIANSAVYEAVQELQDQIGDINSPYNVNITNLLSADNSEAISEAIGGIDNLNATITKNQNIIGAVNNGEVSVSIRKLGNVTSLYYILDTLAGYTVNEINITNTDGTLSKTVVSHSMMTEEMVIDNLTTSESTLPLSANQGKILNDTKQDTLVSGTNIKTVNGNSLLGEGDIEIQAEVPIASADTLGGIKVGEGLQIDDETGVLSSSGEYLPSVNPVVKRDGYYDATLSIGERIVLTDTGAGSSEPSVKITEYGIKQGGKLDIFGWANRNQSRLSGDQLLFIDGSEPDGQDMRPATEITATRIGLGTYVASGPSAPTDLTITKTGITIKQATSEDLLM